MSTPPRLFFFSRRGISCHDTRYYGSFRHMVREAIRATTAAPTFFAPLMINGALYSDGALLCNNPSAVALHEAKVTLVDVCWRMFLFLLLFLLLFFFMLFLLLFLFLFLFALSFLFFCCSCSFSCSYSCSCSRSSCCSYEDQMAPPTRTAPCCSTTRQQWRSRRPLWRVFNVCWYVLLLLFLFGGLFTG